MHNVSVVDHAKPAAVVDVFSGDLKDRVLSTVEKKAMHSRGYFGNYRC